MTVENAEKAYSLIKELHEVIANIEVELNFIAESLNRTRLV